jgi:hypothetical protein
MINNKKVRSLKIHKNNADCKHSYSNQCMTDEIHFLLIQSSLFP